MGNHFGYIIIFFGLLSSLTLQSQTFIKGTVFDENNIPMFAVNVYLQSEPQNGVTTNFNGEFQIAVQKNIDTLIISFIGYESKLIPTKDITMLPISIKLEPKMASLSEVVIIAKDPISEQFSVEKLQRLDIYFDPVAQADPLKAITMLPASTTTDETANPSLRGSSSERSRVILNGVPIYNPVRASNIKNQGFFSLFNTDLIENQYVYASNPPLIYGNTSAGLVEIQTNSTIENNKLQLSAGILNVGFLLSQKLKQETTFIQAYGNYQFSDLYTKIQEKYLPDLKNFYTKDAGINFHTKIQNNLQFNSYNYAINEKYTGIDEAFTYKGEVNSENKRFFTINTLKYVAKNNLVTLSSGANTAKQSYAFGNINNSTKNTQIFTSLNYDLFLLERLNIKSGLSHDYQQYNFQDSTALYYFAIDPSNPHFYSDTVIKNHIIEPYIYGKWNINNQLALSSGLRSNIPTKGQKHYLSYQLGLKYNINTCNSFLLSGGRYYSYTVPNYYAKKFTILSSKQIALDYAYETTQQRIKAAIYYKEEIGKRTLDQLFYTNKTSTFGVELFYEQNLYKYFNIKFSNSFINQKITIDNQKYNGGKDLNYFLKIALKYSNPKLFTCALSYVGRPGNRYTSITGSYLIPEGYYQPLFSDGLFAEQYENYNRLDLNINKYIKCKQNAFIVFLSINNLLNTQNQRRDNYNSDYTSRTFSYYTLRAIYAGIIWQLDY